MEQIINKSNKTPLGVNTKVIKPRKVTPVSFRKVKYKYAQELADALEYNENQRYYCIVNGTFIFGDFIEALITKNNWHVKALTISTLGYSQDNIDSLKNLITGDYLKKLTIIASAEHYGFERAPGRLIPYTYEKLNTGEIEFQLAFADTHMKVVNIETMCGKYITMHGSANLRSSGNVEQFQIEFCKDLYEINQTMLDAIAEKCKTVIKPVRKSALWEIVESN